MEIIEGKWGLLVAIVAVLLIVGIFGAALRFIFSASRTNRKVRLQQDAGAPQGREQRGYKAGREK